MLVTELLVIIIIIIIKAITKLNIKSWSLRKINLVGTFKCLVCKPGNSMLSVF